MESQPVTIGPCTLWLGDCRDILPTLEGVDAVVTDPPYGLGDRMESGAGEWSKGWNEAPAWDRETVAGLVEMLEPFRQVIVWGGNYYPFPPARGWLVWDKCQEHTSGHGELAWTNLDLPVRTFRLSRVEAYSRMNKQHPTQKPVRLMSWCLSFLLEAKVVCDPFAGSGTTGVACVKAGKQCVLIERDPGYFEIACRRIREAVAADRDSLFPAFEKATR